MVSYRYNLLGLGFSPSRYRTIANRALRTARSASAVDTGNFRKGWRIRTVGDFLFVENSVRYAAPVELGSIVHKKHQYKVRDALSRIGLRNGTVSVGAGVSTAFSSNTQSSSRVRATPSTQITEQEIRSPALLLKRNRPKLISFSNLFKVAALATLLAQGREKQGVTQDELSE